MTNIVTISFLALLGLINGQVQIKGRFEETVLALQKAAFNAHSSIFIPNKKVDNLKLQMEEMFEDAKYTKPFKFAESLDLKVDALRDAMWQDTRALDGTPIKIWRAILASDDAVSLSVQFDEFHLPEGAELYIRGRDNMMGAFTAEVNNKPDGSFSTVPITGDFLGIELVVPMDKSNEKRLREELKFKIGKIAHGFRPFPKSYNDSGACNIDVACETNSAYVECLTAYINLLL